MATKGDKKTELIRLLEATTQNKASDLHLLTGVPPTLRVDGSLMQLDYEALTAAETEGFAEVLASADQLAKLKEKRAEIDLAFPYKEFRFRVNIYYARGEMAISLRALSNLIPKLADLGVPTIVETLISSKQGLLVVTGPTGHGKSTTLASIVDVINSTKGGHIITVEDPVEYVFEHKKALISQRQVGLDTPTFGAALKGALREDPDVVLVGEMRDLESVEAVMTLAETGHLVLTTLHTNSASQTADRIVDVFPEHQQSQIRAQLASVLLGIVSQRLLPRVKGGRVLASEVLVANPAVRSTIRDGKTHQLPNIIQTSSSEGMISLDKVLADLVNNGEITLDDAINWAQDAKELKMLIY
jgi:twitching motility protein PilT